MDRTTDFGSVSEGSNPSVVTFLMLFVHGIFKIKKISHLYFKTQRFILKFFFLVSKDVPMNWDDEANASKVN